jgi:regulator of cell morphogenesis and NO signaling
MIHQRIPDLLQQNYVYGYALYSMGIRFFDHEERTLSQVCNMYALNTSVVVKHLQNVATSNYELRTIPLSNHCNLAQLIDYLRSTHRLYIRRKLPYMAELIAAMDVSLFHDANLAEDIKMLFPIFVEDFIKHIHEEEDVLFAYMEQLLAAQKGSMAANKLFWQIEQSILQKQALEHESHDDEMEGIRQLTHDYWLPTNASLHAQVIYAELQHFEKDLQQHAEIENKQLFPKALQVENQVKAQIARLVQFN